MNPTDIIVTSVVVIVGTTIIRRLREKKAKVTHGLLGVPNVTGYGIGGLIVFGFLLTIALLLIAIPAPRIAVAFAYLGLVGAFAVNGPTLFTMLGDLGRGPNATQEARVQEK